MGNSTSGDKKKNKKKDKKNKKNDKNSEGDGFFGPFKWRVFVIGVLLILFSVLQLPLISQSLDSVSETREACLDYCELLPTGEDACKDTCNEAVNETLAALSLIEIGLLCMLIGSICAIVINLVNVNDCCGNCGM